MKEVNKMKYRQGDVGLYQVDSLPKGAKKLKDKVLAYGEISGHRHRFANDSNIERYEVDGRLYLQVYQPTPLIHEEHHEQIILPGTYEQIQEREHDYIDETAKTVID